MRTKRLLGHVVARCGIRPGAASAADLSVPAEAALAFKTFAVAHPRQILALMPYIGKPRFEDASAVHRQIPARKHISLVAHEQHSQTSQTPLGRTVRASTGDGAAAPRQSSGGCSIPLGVYSEINGGNISIYAMISDLEGDKHIKRSITAPLDQALTAGEQLAQELLAAGGQEILDQIRAERCD